MKNNVSINGFRLFGFTDKDNLLAHVAAHKGILIALNAEKLYRRNSELQRLSQNGIGYADGAGAVWALKAQGLKNVTRLPGSELWLDLVEKFAPDSSFYLVGSTEKVIECVIQKLHSQFPSINIVGFRNGFLQSTDFEGLEKDIVSKQPDVIFVAQGSPKQEQLMLSLQAKHPAIYMGLGGSFDVYTGAVRRAPALFRNNGLEWLYRLISQPSRIKRQIVLVPFAFRLLLRRFD
jgi:UDP-N-acetyl-D-mannosaminouronate:lipid I N-acetyl-D-mannosaminouronosyltransferase